MAKTEYIVRVVCTTNPALTQYSHTTTPKERIARLRENIAVVKGEKEGRIYERFYHFDNIPWDEIRFDIYKLTVEGAE